MGKREHSVETYLDEQVREKLGGLTRKYVSPGRNGVADRLVLLPGGRVVFVECKSMDGVESHGQMRERRRMHGLGMEAVVVTCRVDVDVLVTRVIHEIALC